MDQLPANGPARRSSRAKVGAFLLRRDLILTCKLSPGDVVMMTAAVRDLPPGLPRTVSHRCPHVCG